MNDVLFDISGLKCAYNNAETVLVINDLRIPAKKISVLLGISGAGKSTFLETLGLMNNTIVEGELLFYPNNGSNVIKLAPLWNKEDLSKIRNKYFSFIFQNTNLMPNLTALENVCITQMIQGRTFLESLKRSREIMAKVGLENISENKKVYELSGGQQQRLAFVRAITPDFTVLFGDEPTGNLDDYNSEELMNIIRDEILESNKSAVIVSHNIDLAIKFADFIMVINKNHEKGYGEISENTVFYSKRDANGAAMWFKSNNDVVDDIKHRIKQLLF